MEVCSAVVQRVHKFGNSLAVVIPASANKRHRLSPGSMVEVTETPDGWQVRPVEIVPRLAADLRELADQIADERTNVFDALAE